MLRDWSFRLTGVVSKKRSISMPASRLLLNLWLPGSARVRAFRFQGCHSTDAARESDQPDASGLSGATINQISHIRHSRRTNLSHPTRYTRASSSPHPANRLFLVNRTDDRFHFLAPEAGPALGRENTLARCYSHRSNFIVFDKILNPKAPEFLILPFPIK